jgi:hypothetical protein
MMKEQKVKSNNEQKKIERLLNEDWRIIIRIAQTNNSSIQYA